MWRVPAPYPHGLRRFLVSRLLLSTFLALAAWDLSGAESADALADEGAVATAAADGLEVTVRLDAERYLTQANTIRCIKAPWIVLSSVPSP